MADLYLDPLLKVRFDDVVNFLTSDPRPREGLTLEFKQDWSRSIVFDICAFANTAGGLLVIGVPDSGPGTPGAILGVDERSVISGKVASLCHTGIMPPYVPEWNWIPIPNQPARGIVLIRVKAHPLSQPLWNPEKGVLVRHDDQCRPADLETLHRLLNSEVDLSPADKEFQRAASSAQLRNADQHPWLSVVVQYPQHFAMTSSWKKEAMVFSSNFFSVPASAMTRRILSDFCLFSLKEIPKQTLALHGSGVLDLASQLPEDPVLLTSVINGLGRCLLWMARDPLFLADPDATIPVLVTLSNMPQGGVSPGGVLPLQRLGNDRPWGYPCEQSYLLNQTDWLDHVIDFSGRLLNEDGYVDYENPLAVTGSLITRLIGKRPW